MERHAAEAALGYIRDGMTIGLGSGKAINYLIEFISMGHFPTLKVTTNQLSTALQAKEKGLNLVPASLCDRLDYAFDTLNYMVKDITGVKVNTTVVCEDKMMAAMADHAVYLVDKAHVADILDDGIPVEVEVVKPALSYAARRLEEMNGRVFVEDPARRQQVMSAAGNYIIEVRFKQIDDLKALDLAISSIPGVVATSLFTDINAMALVYDKDNVEVLGNIEEDPQSVQ